LLKCGPRCKRSELEALRGGLLNLIQEIKGMREEIQGRTRSSRWNPDSMSRREQAGLSFPKRSTPDMPGEAALCNFPCSRNFLNRETGILLPLPGPSA
jgi:hypothetical protein